MYSQLSTGGRNSQFVILNAVGWLGYCLNTYIGAFFLNFPRTYYGVSFLAAVCGFGLSLLLRITYRRFWHVSLPQKVLCVIVGSAVCSLLWSVPHTFLTLKLIPSSGMMSAWTEYFWGASTVLYVFVCWSCLYFGIKYHHVAREATRRELKAIALAHDAQIKMLRYQLNPHFLFNALNAVSTLILEKRAELANETIIQLSNFLRHSLDKDPVQKVTLEQEIAALNRYLAIEKVRFGDRLNLHVEVDERAGSCLVPSLMLQPLIENSIKYAIGKSKGGGAISIRAEIASGRLRLILRDDGPGMAPTDGEVLHNGGIGIRNTKERLKQLYEDRHRFSIAKLEPNGMQICIELPHEPA